MAGTCRQGWITHISQENGGPAGITGGLVQHFWSRSSSMCSYHWPPATSPPRVSCQSSCSHCGLCKLLLSLGEDSTVCARVLHGRDITFSHTDLDFRVSASQYPFIAQTYLLVLGQNKPKGVRPWLGTREMHMSSTRHLAGADGKPARERQAG